MKGYLIANVKVEDQDLSDEYSRRVDAVVAQFGGKFLVRGGKVTPVEGEMGLHRLVVLEFESTAQAQAFYDSPAYHEVLPLRLDSCTSTLVIAEGVGGSSGA